MAKSLVSCFFDSRCSSVSVEGNASPSKLRGEITRHLTFVHSQGTQVIRRVAFIATAAHRILGGVVLLLWEYSIRRRGY